MRRLPPGSIAFSDMLVRVIPILAFLGAFVWVEARAQEVPAASPAPDATADAASPDEAPPAASIPLGRYIARDRLFLHVEFAGLDAHDDAWRKTAAYRMLNETSLGVMLEEVGAQLAERVLGYLPNRKIGGAEAVTILEHMARKGWALGLAADPQAPTGVRGVLVLRGVVNKEMKPLFSRLMGTFMSAEVKPKIERKGSRVMVSVPPINPEEGQADQGWVWWPEGDDLVVGLLQPSDADLVHAALDGQAPSVEGFEPIADLAKPEGEFEPVLTVWFDPAGATAAVGAGGSPALGAVAQLFADANVKRIDHRWGFDGDGLMSVTRLTAPKPRKGILALFNEPSFEAKNLLAVPEGVDFFASMSIKPEQWPEILAGALGSGEARAGFDAFADEMRARRSDIEKDLLGNIGPRALFYLAPGGSAAAAAPTEAPGMGLIPAPVLGALTSRFPRPVLVAEVVDPPRFGRALETLMFEVNKRIKIEAQEQAAAVAQAEADGQRGGGFPGAQAGPGAGPGAGRATRKRDSEPPVPEFRLIPGSTSSSERTYMFTVPTAYPVKPFPPGVKPTIRLEGNRVALSTSPEAARLAIEALREKDWTPSADIAQTLAQAPDNSVFVIYGDSRETSPTILASLPGALQAQINTAITVASQPPEANPNMGGPAGGPGGPGFAGPGGFGSSPGGPGGAGSSSARIPGGPGSSAAGPGGLGSSAAGPGGPGSSSSYLAGSSAAGPGGMGSSAGALGGMGSSGGRPGMAPRGRATTEQTLIQIRVDPAHLPRADELKALMFPSTTSVVVDDEAIRVVTREAIPETLVTATANGALTALLIPAFRAANQAAAAAEAAANPDGAAQQPGRPGTPPGPGSAPGPGPGIPGPGPGIPGAAPGPGPGIPGRSGGPMVAPGGPGSAPGAPAKSGRRRDDK